MPTKVVKRDSRGRSRSRSNATKKVRPIEKLTKKQEELLDIYYNKKELCDHLWIEDTIDYISDPEGKTRLKELESMLKSFEQNDNLALIIHFDSGGGDAGASFFIYNFLERFTKPKIGVIEHFCASATTFPFMACELRILKPYSLFLIHQIRFPGVEGNVETFKDRRRDIFSDQRKYESQIKFYMDHSKAPEAIVKKYFRAELYMPYTEMLKWGFAHHMFDSRKVKKIRNQNGQEIDMIFPSFQENLKVLIRSEIIKQENIKSIKVWSTYEDRSMFTDMMTINLMLEIPCRIEYYIGGEITNGQFLTSLIADKSYLISPYSNIEITPQRFLKEGLQYNIDSMEYRSQRSEILRKMIIDLLKSKTKLPKNIIDDIIYKTFTFNIEEAKKYKLVDEIIKIDQGKIEKVN